jgi:hypothetical protein
MNRGTSRNRRFLNLVVVVLVAMSLSACGDDPPPNPPYVPLPADMGMGEDAVNVEDVEEYVPGERSRNIEYALNLFTQTECDVVFRCCNIDEVQSQFGWSSQDACLQDGGDGGGFSGVTALDKAAGLGRILFNKEYVELCARSFETLPCEYLFRGYSSPFNSAMPGCREVITPLTELAAECDFSYECKSGYCSSGVCTGHLGLGDPCTTQTDLACRPGLFCDGVTTMKCIVQEDVGGTCISDWHCLSGECTDAQVCTAVEPMCSAGE